MSENTIPIETHGARQKVRVRCTYEIEITLPIEWDEKEIQFYVEDNGCPACGEMGSVLYEEIEKMNTDGTCWACAHKGKCEVISGDGNG